MAIPSFYHPLLTDNETLVELDQAEASHAIKARRLKSGHKVRLFNGAGLVAKGELSNVGRRTASVLIHSVTFEQANSTGLHIAVAMPKGDRQKVMLDMLTQLGVSKITPLVCEYSVSKVNDNSAEKWQRVMVEAAKQSQNPYLPIIQTEMALPKLLDQHRLKQTTSRLFYANADGASLFDALSFKHTIKPTQKFDEYTVLVGPEGGFSVNEFDLFAQLGISSISLGGHILRTEAAAIAVMSQFNQLLRA